MIVDLLRRLGALVEAKGSKFLGLPSWSAWFDDPKKAKPSKEPHSGEHPEKEKHSAPEKSKTSYSSAEKHWGPETFQKPSKWQSAGGVVVAGLDPEGLTKVWIRKSKKSPGYKNQWTFPKGRIDKGENAVGAAIREVGEEMGISAKIVPSGMLGKFEGDFSSTTFFLMVSSGVAGAHDDETEKVGLYTWEKAVAKLALSGNNRDVKVAKAAMDVIRKKFKIDPIRGARL